MIFSKLFVLYRHVPTAHVPTIVRRLSVTPTVLSSACTKIVKTVKENTISNIIIIYCNVQDSKEYCRTYD